MKLLVLKNSSHQNFQINLMEFLLVIFFCYINLLFLVTVKVTILFSPLRGFFRERDHRLNTQKCF